MVGRLREVQRSIVVHSRGGKTGNGRWDTGYGIRDTGNGVSASGIEVRDLESGFRPNVEHVSLRVPFPVSRIPSPVSRGPLELSYVYEVDAMETPEVESQVVPEDEPSISISVSRVESLEDQVLPFEARPEVKAGATSPAGPKASPRGNKKRRGPKDSARKPAEGQPPLTGAE